MAPVADADSAAAAASVPVHYAAEPPKPMPLVRLDYRPSPYWNSSCPIVIDNGSSELRAGFSLASSSHPLPAAPAYYYDNYVSKVRDRKKNLSLLMAGNDVYADGLTRGAIRSPFDADVVCNWDAMETMLDYTFSNLGIDTERVQHPICMTETLCNPAYSRGIMNELLFEAYDVPYVNYGLDCLFSAYQNDVREDALVVSSGHNSTVIVPMVGGKGILTNAKRLSWGGAQATELLYRLIQLKYPGFPTRVTTWQARNMLEELCYVSSDYGAEIRGMEMMPSSSSSSGSLSSPVSPSQWTAMEKADVIVQFPYLDAVPEQKSEEELRAQAERRKAAGLRLQEQTRKMRLEKMVQKENDLRYYAQLKEWKAKERKSEYLKRLESEGFDTEQELENTIKKVEAALKRSRAKELGEEAPEEESKEEPSFPLVDVPDGELDDEEIKEKRKQRLMKAGYEARLRAKAEKEEEERQRQAEIQRDEDERINDPKAWSRRMRKDYDDAIERIKQRKRLKEMLSDRKSLAAQQRMKSITALASDSPGGAGGGSMGGSPAPGGGLSTGGGGGGGGGGSGGAGGSMATAARKRKRGGDEDTFGADDNDWSIYREIQAVDDSEEEEESYAHLAKLESRLLESDPDFTREDTYAARVARKNRLLLTFFNGPGGGVGTEGEEDGVGPEQGGKGKGKDEKVEDAETVKRQHQLHLNVERIRVPEVLWQPSIAGVDQAGIDELANHVLNNFEMQTKAKMLSNLFYTGRHTLLPNFGTRLSSSIRATQPTSLSIRLRPAKDPRFDAWRGMAKWTSQEQELFRSSAITRQEYNEKGHDWFVEHALSANWTA
ncbi:Actin-related protein 5 [Thecaphora frezii]